MTEELERFDELLDDLIDSVKDLAPDSGVKHAIDYVRNARKNIITEITRLKARVATLERIMEREAEKTAKAGMPKEGINGKDN